MTESDVLIALGKMKEHNPHWHSYTGNEQFFMTKVKTGSTWFNPNLKIIDAVSIKKSWKKPCIIFYEVKVARSDFVNDEK